MDIEPGTVVANRYRISRAIGRGGMGEVFAAENIRTGRPVAIKLLRADSKTKSSAVERFRREARAAGSINSDHVTQVLDVEDDSEHGIVIVFELLEGESLIDRLKRTGPIPFDELHPIIEEVWVGLSDAHKAGIIHRDLKPSNVFLEKRPDGLRRVKLLDFGISKLPKEMGGETLTEMGQSLGTFSFMPPEQIGRAKTVDHRADIYATTTMIYQSLTGQLPYIARNILVMVELKSKTDPRPLAEALSSPVDDALEAFIAKGLARNPADRFQSALEALEKWRDLKQIQVPASRRMISSFDLNSQARLAQTPVSPMPAVSGRPGTVPPGSNALRGVTGPGAAVRIHTPPFALSTGAVPSAMAPAPVVPKAMLEPVMGALPRLYDQTESTTDISDVDSVQPATEQSGIKPTVQPGQELRGAAAGGERQGPAGTRVMPQSVVKEAVAYAEARKAGASIAQAQAAQAAAQAQAQAQAAQAAYVAQGGYAAAPTPAAGIPYTPSATPSQGMQAIPKSNLAAQPARPVPNAELRVGSSSAPPPPGSGAQPIRAPQPSAPPSGIQPIPSGSGAHPASSVPQSPVPPMQRMPTPTPASSSPPSPAPSGMRMASSPPQAPLGPAISGPPALHTLRLPEEQSSVPASQDRTTVYRPKKKAPEKKSSLAVYVLGAIAFAVVGFGIVYLVQLIVRTWSAH